MTKHYIDNKEMLQQMIVFLDDCNACKDRGEPRPKVPEYIGHAIFSIANRLASKSNFANYTYRDDMISDGIETCIRYVDRFDPSKSQNPFAYFTQIIYYAFLQRIQKEKKHSYIKHKVFENSILMNTLVDMGIDDSNRFDNATVDIDSSRIADLIEKFEKRQSPKKQVPPSDTISDDQQGVLYEED